MMRLCTIRFMKKVILVCTFLFVHPFNLPLFSVYGGEYDEHISIEQSLELSLGGLKDSIQGVKKKNAALTMANISLRNDIQVLQQTLEDLSARRIGLPGEKAPAYEYGWQEKSLGLIDAQKRAQKVRELVNIFQKDVKEIGGAVTALDVKLNKREFSFRRYALLKQKRESEKRLLDAQRELQKLQKQKKTSRKVIGDLETENVVLRQKMRLLRSKL